jgi:hypothetical protein
MRLKDVIRHKPGKKTKHILNLVEPAVAKDVKVKTASCKVLWGGLPAQVITAKKTKTTARTVHLEIAAGAPACEYDLHVTVTDTKGKKHVFKLWVRTS